MTKDYFKRVVAADIINKAFTVAEYSTDERAFKAYAEVLASQIMTYCQASDMSPFDLRQAVLDSTIWD